MLKTLLPRLRLVVGGGCHPQIVLSPFLHIDCPGRISFRTRDTVLLTPREDAVEDVEEKPVEIGLRRFASFGHP